MKENEILYSIANLAYELRLYYIGRELYNFGRDLIGEIHWINFLTFAKPELLEIYGAGHYHYNPLLSNFYHIIHRS